MKKIIILLLVLILSACGQNNKSPEIFVSGVLQNPTINLSDDFDVIKGVFAVDYNQVDISDSITVSTDKGSIVDNMLLVNTPGEYTLTYTATDGDDRTVTFIRVVTFVDDELIFKEEFNEDLSNWEIEANNNNFNFEINDDQKLQVDILSTLNLGDTGSTKQGNINLVKNDTYHISFDAKALENKMIVLNIIDSENNNIGEKAFYVTDKNSEFDYYFVPDKTISEAYISIDFGYYDAVTEVGDISSNEPTTVYVDNITITKTDFSNTICKGIEGCNEFIEQLLSSMTVEEKAAQMLQAERNGISVGDVYNYKIGSILSGGGSAPSTNTPDGWYNMYYNYQIRALLSGNHIPLIYGIDAVHGNNNLLGATLFPHNIGLGAANNPDLMKQIGRVVAGEMRVTGISWNFAPTIASVQDIRWGRTYESFSENIDRVTALTGPYIEGLQSYGVSATAKHFIGDGNTSNGTDQGDAILTQEDINELLKPYIAAVNEGVDTVMISYSSINGIKMHGNYDLITGTLKNDLNFRGFVVSDYNAIHQLPGDYYQQIVTSVNAGIDMLMEPFTWKDAIDNIVQAVENGDITETRLNDAVRRILTVKYDRGLFDFSTFRLDPNQYFATDENKAVAAQAVRESLVLLKNDDVLPLSKSDNVLILGPFTDNVSLLCGGWSIGWQGDYGDNWTIQNTIPGTSIYDGMSQVGTGTIYTDISDASNADVVIAVIGENMYAEYNGDNSYLDLVNGNANDQNTETLQEAYSTGLPVVVVMISGRPLLVQNEVNNWDAFVAAWLPGSEGGLGIAQVLFGDYDFSGTLPVTWPKDSLQFGYNSNSDRYDPNLVMYPYGYGLRYDNQ